MKRWQSYRRPNFRSQLILSEFFASQTAIKKCLNTRVLTTLERLGESGATHDSQSASRSGVEAWVARNLNGWDDSDAGLSQGWVRCPSGLASLISLHHSRLSTRSSYQLYSFSGGRRFCYDNHGSFVYDSPNLFCGPSCSVRTGLTGVRSEPGHRTHLTSLLYYMRSYMLIGPFKCSQLRSRVRELGPVWAARSSIDQPSSPNFALLGDQNPNLSLTSFKRRRTWQQEQAKKARGSLSTVRAAAGFAELAQLRWSSLHCAQKIVSKKKKSTEQWRKELSICTLLMIEQTLISLAFTRGQPKLTKLWTKTCNRCPHRQRVTFQAGHAESTIPLNSENWVHVLLIPQVQYYPPAPTNMKKHLRVTSDEEKLVSLPCEWVLIDHGFRDRTLHPAHPLAKKSLKQLLRDPHEHSQTCFLYFRGRGIHWWRRFSCAVNESWRKIQVQTLHCSQQLLQS